MKLHLLTAAVLATLASTAALAASEGGDTWSEVQPAPQSTYSIVQSAPHVASHEPALDAAFEGSEGGDTWSSLQALRETGDQQVAQDRSARIDTDYARLDFGSEGGDTWSRFVPQFQSQPMSSTNLASGAPIEQPH